MKIQEDVLQQSSQAREMANSFLAADDIKDGEVLKVTQLLPQCLGFQCQSLLCCAWPRLWPSTAQQRLALKLGLGIVGVPRQP